MVANVVISVAPTFVERMRTGSKRAELRRRMLKLDSGTIVWVYETSPINSISGYFQVSSVIRVKKESAWADYQKIISVTRSEFEAYVGDLEWVVLVLFDDFYSLSDPLHLCDLKELSKEFHPPQFYAMLKDLKLIRELSFSI